MNLDELKQKIAALPDNTDGINCPDCGRVFHEPFTCEEWAAKYYSNRDLKANHWTPTEERLPTRRGIYYVTLADGSVTTSAFYVGAFDRGAIAWMPYPAPYQPKQEAGE